MDGFLKNLADVMSMMECGAYDHKKSPRSKVNIAIHGFTDFVY